MVKAKKYQLRGKLAYKRLQNFTRMTALVSGHPVPKSIAIHFHPCNLELLPQNTCSIVFLCDLLANLFDYLVAFAKIMWK